MNLILTIMGIVKRTIFINFNCIINNKRHTLSVRANDQIYCQASVKRVENTLVLLDTCLRGRFPAINANYYYCRLSLQFFFFSHSREKPTSNTLLIWHVRSRQYEREWQLIRNEVGGGRQGKGLDSILITGGRLQSVRGT